MIKVSRSQILCANLPMPPSENEAYLNGRYRARALSKVAEDFKNEMRVWRIKNARMITLAAEEMAGWHTPTMLTVLVGFRHDRIWTKADQPKRIDASNYVKLLQDSLTDALGFDDSKLWGTNVEKAALPIGSTQQRCIAILAPGMPRRFDQWKDHLGIV